MKFIIFTLFYGEYYGTTFMVVKMLESANTRLNNSIGAMKLNKLDNHFTQAFINTIRQSNGC